MSSVKADIDSAVRSLFRRCPPLCGFRVREAGDGAAPEERIALADVTLQPWADDAEWVAGEIALALGDLLDERPEAGALLAGRTFARVLQ